MENEENKIEEEVLVEEAVAELGETPACEADCACHKEVVTE